MEELYEDSLSFSETIDVTRIIGVEVLSSQGLSVGRVKQVRFDTKTMSFEGLLVSRGLFRKRVFIGATYIAQFNPDRVILSIEPALLLYNRKVLTHEGRYLGRVLRVQRDGCTNKIKHLVVKKLFRPEKNIPVLQIEHLGRSIILNESYGANATQRNRQS